MERRTIATLALVTMVALSGCSLLSGPLTFTAAKATVSDQALSETGYETANVSKTVVERQFSVAGQSKKVTVTNWIATYERTVDLGPIGERRAAVFSVISTPQVEILGRDFNPIGDYSNQRLVKMVQQQYGGISNVRTVSSQNTTVLDKQTKVTKFAAQAQFQGRQIDVYLHVTKVAHEGDYVVAVAVYPQLLSGEEQRVFTLLHGIQHQVEEGGGESGDGG